MLAIKRMLNRIILMLFLVVLSYNSNAQISSYITNHKILATILGMGYGIPPSVILAIALVESSAGNGATAKVLNNHFGIVGQNEFVNDKGHSSRYKQYTHEFESYLDFCKMISRKRFYSKLKDNDNPKLWVKAISKAGYSEDPEQWEKKIFGIIASNKL